MNITMKNIVKTCLLITSAALLITGCRLKEDGGIYNKQVVNLEKYWKFSIGNNPKWADKNFDDDDWEEIKVPSRWEDQGFNGYDGYAWYRIHFEYEPEMRNHDLYLDLGKVDDADRTYLNGKLIGFTGTFPPEYQTAYFATRRYYIPPELLDEWGDNVIAVQVYDSELSGGITWGNIVIEIEDSDVTLDFNLAGLWKFKTGDDSVYSQRDFHDTDWKLVSVPAYWEVEGYAGYDGFGWYRREFKLPEKLQGKSLILLMGKIDDIDQTYLNGHMVGSIGDFTDNPPVFNKHNEYAQLRAYSIPAKYLDVNGTNVVAVRVYDGYRDGGIYQGPIGLLTSDRLTSFYRKHAGEIKLERKDNSFW